MRWEQLFADLEARVAEDEARAELAEAASRARVETGRVAWLDRVRGATGQQVELEPAYCEHLLAGMQPVEELMRSSGQYGPAVPVAEDDDIQTRVLAFIGRDPQWRP